MTGDATRPEAVVLIHGSNGKAKNECLELLLQGLEQVPERWKVSRAGPPRVGGLEGQSINIARTKGDAGRTLDVFEAFWGDLTPRLSQQPLSGRVKSGASLLVYWLFSRVWGGVWKYRWLSVQLILAAAVVMLWYYGALATFLSASSGDLVGQSDGSETLRGLAESGPLKSVIDFVKGLVEALGTWKPWALAMVLMGFVPTGQVVDAFNLSRLYLLDWRSGEESVGVRARTRKRIERVLRDVVESGHYGRVTVVAHSFGVLLAVDVLGDFETDSDVELRLLTLGGPLEVLVHREDWVQKEIDKCAANTQVSSWVDIFSEEDWLGFRTPPPTHSTKLAHHQTSHRASIIDKLLGRTHLWYFGNQDVLTYVLGDPLPTPDARPDGEKRAA